MPLFFIGVKRMADFCRACAKKNLGITDTQYDKYGDLMGLCEEGQQVGELCEGCGFITVDHRGVRIEPTEPTEDAKEPVSNGGW